MVGTGDGARENCGIAGGTGIELPAEFDPEQPSALVHKRTNNMPMAAYGGEDNQERNIAFLSVACEVS